VARLGHPDDPVSLDPESALEPCRLGRLSTGRFISSAPMGGGELITYDEAGRASLAIGRTGRGPGELLGSPLLIVGPGDTLHVVDNQNARLQVMTSDGTYVRSFRLPTRIVAAALLDDGGYALSPAWTSITEPGQTLFLRYSAEGDALGAGGAWDGARVTWGQGWLLSPALPTGFWSGKESRLGGTLWHADGTQERSLRRVTGWFPPDAPLAPDFPASAPGPLLTHVWQDDGNRLWLYALVARNPWTPWPGVEEGRLDIPIAWVQEAFRTRVEVVDLNGPVLLVSDSFGAPLMPVCGSPLVYSIMEAAGGDTRVEVYEPSLEDPPFRTGKPGS